MELPVLERLDLGQADTEPSPSAFGDYIDVGLDVCRSIDPTILVYVSRYFAENHHVQDPPCEQVDAKDIVLVFTFKATTTVDDDTRYKMTMVVNFVNACRDVVISDMMYSRRQIFLQLEYKKRLYGGRHKFTKTLGLIDYVLNGYLNSKSGFYKIWYDYYDVSKEDRVTKTIKYVEGLKYKGVYKQQDFEKLSSSCGERKWMNLRNAVICNGVDTNKYYCYVTYLGWDRYDFYIVPR